ncbi:amidohydrolase family protein [Occallatibacter riparius]|uniref:Amidohydrolase family protein n=1 Tax=Occallatibacter riparius TaxID=1002689 RepID=A0A9J7BNZ8_9BACT|nr:amidohydrolase family protein [Occallatibacter riparius]UWZ84249.1 amidohydrolase family protein [Occallatibacter riparius]
MNRIDAHQHFWNYDPVEYGWIDEPMAALRRDFLPQDLKPLLSQVGFQGCIAVQARQSLEETRWLLSLAKQNDFIRGVVGWVDLRSAQLPDQLRDLTRDPKLVGVRHVVQAEPDDDFMLRADFRRGIAQLAAFGLAYDILVYPRQLRAAVKLVSQFPEQHFVLDHIAKPLIAQGAIEPWNTEIRALAQFPNVMCKVSGMVTEARWTGWQPEDFRPYLDVIFEAFGPERIMIGSDWPVCTVAADYHETIGIVTDYIDGLSTAQQDAILGGNCAAFYRLPE